MKEKDEGYANLLEYEILGWAFERTKGSSQCAK